MSNPVTILGSDLTQPGGKQQLQDALDVLYGLIGAPKRPADELKLRKLIVETIEVTPGDKPPANAFGNLFEPWITGQRGRGLQMRYEDQNDGGDLLEWRFQPYFAGSPTATTGDWELAAYTAQRATGGGYSRVGAFRFGHDGRIRTYGASEALVFDSSAIQSSVGFGGDGSAGAVTVSASGYLTPGDQYTNLTINAGTEVSMDWSTFPGPAMVVRCTGDLVVNGWLHMDGRGSLGGVGGIGSDGEVGGATASTPTVGNAGGAYDSVSATGGGGGGGRGHGSVTATANGAAGATGIPRTLLTLDGAGFGAGGAGATADNTAGANGTAVTATSAAWLASFASNVAWKWALFTFAGAPGAGGGAGSGGRRSGAGTGASGGSAGSLGAPSAATDHGDAGDGFHGGDAANSGGGGGGGSGGHGGGLIYMEVVGDVTIGASGVISADGGDGGDGGRGGDTNAGATDAPGAGGGGGSGGGGGLIVIRYGGTFTNNGTIRANGGAGGAGGATGTGDTLVMAAAGGNGAAGEAGYVLTLKEAP